MYNKETIYKAKLIDSKLQNYKLGDVFEVKYIGIHYGEHMWVPVVKNYLAIYNNQIEIITESATQKVA